MPAHSIEPTEIPPAVTATIWRARLAVLFAVIVATSVGAFLLSLVSYAWPIGTSDFPTFAELSDRRSYVWAFFVLAGIQLVVGVCAAAIAGLVLTPARGSRLGTVGAALLFLGAAAYGVGIGGWATVYWFGTDTTVLDPAAATRLIHEANHDAAHMLVIPIAGRSSLSRQPHAFRRHLAGRHRAEDGEHLLCPQHGRNGRPQARYVLRPQR